MKSFRLIPLIAATLFFQQARALMPLTPDTVRSKQLQLIVCEPAPADSTATADTAVSADVINPEPPAYTFLTTGTTPYLYTLCLDRALRENEINLSFEYKSSTGLNYLQLFLKTAGFSIGGPRLTDIDTSSTWRTQTFDLSSYREQWGDYLHRLYFRTGSKDSAVFSIRNIRIHAGPADTLPDNPDSINTAARDKENLYKILNLGLPVVWLTTENGEMPSYESALSLRPDGCMGSGLTAVTKVPGRVDVYNTDSTLLFTSGNYNGSDSGMTVKVRGNSMRSEKMPYKIKLVKKGDMLGRPDTGTNFKDKNWVLLKDERRQIQSGFKVNEVLNRGWTPQGMEVNVFLNGDYRGHYRLSESVERNTDCRIDISKNGFIAELDAYWWNENGEYLSSRFHPHFNYTFKYPDYEDMEAEDSTYIHNCLQTFENALYNREYDRHIDMYSFASWVLGHDILGTFDGPGANKFLCRDNRKEDSRLWMGTMWDFDAICYNKEQWSGAHYNSFFEPLWADTVNRAFMRAYVALWDSVNEDVFARLNTFEISQRSGPAAEAFDRSADYNELRWLEGPLHASVMANFYAGWFEDRQLVLEGLIDEYRQIILADTLPVRDTILPPPVDTTVTDTAVTDTTGVHVWVERNLSQLKVFGRGRQIIVRGAEPDTRVFVFDIIGRNLYRGPVERMPAMPSPGVYLVRLQGRTFKVPLK